MKKISKKKLIITLIVLAALTLLVLWTRTKVIEFLDDLLARSDCWGGAS